MSQLNLFHIKQQSDTPFSFQSSLPTNYADCEPQYNNYCNLGNQPYYQQGQNLHFQNYNLFNNEREFNCDFFVNNYQNDDFLYQ
jgi:hypothetical protein